MDELKKELLARKDRLEKAISSAESFLESAPFGSLRISKSTDCTRYYLITQKGDTNGKYIHAEDRPLICQLAQKDYAKKLLAEARQELHDTEVYLRGIDKHNSESVYSKLDPKRQFLAEPILRNSDERIRYWNSLPYNISSYEPDEKIYPTKRGELVRSKSELLIADMYYDLGIPYRYECELKLKNGKVKYPDFTLYHSSRRTVYYHEHLGCLDDDAYRARNMRKLRLYEDNGIFPGKNLLISWESESFPFNIQSFREQIKELFDV
ncbi:MAG: hypothetical protein IKI87_04575 [Clostridiales bacterium]|nr:hypothetical protein [Clostridiales bacterium]